VITDGIHRQTLSAHGNIIAQGLHNSLAVPAAYAPSAEEYFFNLQVREAYDRMVHNKRSPGQLVSGEEDSIGQR
jgi:hypothetical protein